MTGKERTQAEQSIPIDLDLGTLHFSMTLGRQSILSDDYRYMLDEFGISGFIASDELLQEIAEYSPEDIDEEFKAIVTSPQQKATYQILGYVLSPEGFARFKRPFLSLDDGISRNIFRAIADNLLETDLPFFDPAVVARNAMTNPVGHYGRIPKYWAHDEIYAQLQLAFSERGKVLDDIGEHLDKHNPSIYWPGHVGRILALAHKLRISSLTNDEIDTAKRIIHQDINLIKVHSDLTEKDVSKIRKEVNRIAGKTLLVSA